MSTPPSVESLLAELIAVSQEELRWHRAAVMPQVRKTIEETLATTQMRKAYELCDGEHTFRDIATSVGAGLSTLSRWTRRWRDLGIAFERPDGRIEHLVSLDALGLPSELGDEPPKTRSRSPASRKKSA
jgi:hypothetical protein